jgi:AsmA protein
LRAALGREVKVGNLKLALLSGGVTADDLSIADDPAFSGTPFVQATSFHVGVDLAALIFSRKLAVTSLAIDQPRIALLQSPAGEWNFSSLGTKPGGEPAATEAGPDAKPAGRPAAATEAGPGAKPAPRPAAVAEAPGNGSKLDLSVKLVRIADGEFTMGHAGSHLKPLVLQKVNAELRDFSPASAFPFSLSMTVAGGGTIKLEGKAGPIDETDVALTPATLTLKVDGLDLAGSGLNQIAPAAAGLISFDGSGQTSGTRADIKGRLKIDKLKLSPKGTPARRVLELDFGVTHDLKKRSGTVDQGDIHIGGAIARLTGTYTPQGESLAVAMTLSGPAMQVQELTEMLPALGVVLPMGSSLQGGTAAVKASIAGPVDKLVTTASLSLNNTRLAGFNVLDRMSSIEKLAGLKGGKDTEIQVFSGNVKVAPDGMTADSIKLVLPAIGDLEGSGTVSPDNVLNFKMQASLHVSGVAAAIDNRPVPFTVEGTCAQPVFHPDVKAVMKQEVKGLGGGVGKAAGGLFKGLAGGKK